MRYVQKIASMKDVTIQMDTTYWGRDFGLMVIKEALRNRILWRKYVTHETISNYMEGIVPQVARIQDIRRGDGRHEGPGPDAESLSHADVSVPPGADSQALPHAGSRAGCIKGPS